MGGRPVMRPRGGGAAEVPMCRGCRVKMESQEKMLKRNTENGAKQAARWAHLELSPRLLPCGEWGTVGHRADRGRG